jgi:ribosomal protein S18 acetylase RimI-like enzyme
MTGPTLELSTGVATEADVAAIAALRTAVAEDLTSRHGRGHWSSCVTEKSVLRGLKTSRVLVTRSAEGVVGTVRLATKKPWAIDLKNFVSVRRPLYVHDLAVAPSVRRNGVGRLLMEEAKAVARSWPADAIRLDAYDHAAGAGELYVKCGFREVGRVTYRGVPLVYFELLL